MLKWRVVTALMLVVPLIAALFLLSSAWLAAVFGMVAAVAAHEWAGLSGLRPGPRVAYAATLVTAGGLLVTGVLHWPALATPVLLAALVWWLLVLVMLVRSPEFFEISFLKLAAGFLVLIPVWVAVVFLHATDVNRPWTLLFNFFLVAVADIVAYFVGRKFGKTKLAPAISPGKTVEGLLGALVAVVLVAYIYGTMALKFDAPGAALFCIWAIVTALFSVLGDLTESKFKRIAGVKDSGRLLPGHGGVLDRIDAHTSAVPIFTLGWWFLF